MAAKIAKKAPKKVSESIDGYEPLACTKEAFEKSFNQHLHHTLGVGYNSPSTDYEKYLSIAYSVRDRLIDKWMQTKVAYQEQKSKMVYYFSLEFLIGRSFGNSIINIDIENEVKDALDEMSLSMEELREAEVDAGLGNGGLGRLAACFIDSMATLGIPACGMGIRYEYGMFHQRIENGHQVEKPDHWLKRANPWELARPEKEIKVPFYGEVNTYIDQNGVERKRWETKDYVLAVPYDTPVPGFRNGVVNNLRLWSAKSNDDFGLDYFNSGDYIKAIESQELSETISKVLYPNDSSMNGKELRLKQQFFLCSAGLQDIVKNFKVNNGDDFSKFHEKVAIQLNDTHPAVSIPELMRILLDEEGLNWDEAWKVCQATFAYTNHTLMPEALEKWPVFLFEKILPRHLQIIYEINYHFLRDVSFKWPGDTDRLARMSIVEEGDTKMIRMAFLSIIGSHSVNGVAALHTELLKNFLVKDFFDFYPEKFNNKTNGITQRRWLLKSNPKLSSLITDTIGDAWITDLDDLKKLEKHASKAPFQKVWNEIKKENKKILADILEEQQNISINPESIFDIQVKRIHEYKRQLLNVLHAIHLYCEIKYENKKIVPRTIIVGGKAAPGYYMAKLIIKLVTAVGEVVNNDKDVGDMLKVVFIENYRVSLAEKIFPASELSEQISTAGTEASGTGNMKFALNGALTIGTLDGANVEIAEEVGDENIFIFGKKIEEVQELEKSGYNPRDYYDKSPNLKRVIDLIQSGFFSPEESGLFEPILSNLMNHDQYLLFADFDSFVECQEKVSELYTKPKEWTTMSIMNVARIGKFSSDRTIKQYNDEIWKAPIIKM
ncbi:MAG: glycogen/starch/alpha-glucan phosphorylase [Fibrobacterales bacterium]